MHTQPIPLATGPAKVTGDRFAGSSNDPETGNELQVKMTGTFDTYRANFDSALAEFTREAKAITRGNRWCGGRIGLTPSVRQCRDVERAEEGSKPALGQAADDDR